MISQGVGFGKGLTEKDLLAQVKDYLKIKGVFFFRVHQSLGSTPGIPDIIAIHPIDRRLMGLELKGAKGKLSPHQKNFLEAITQAGGIGAEIRSVEDVEKLLENNEGGKHGS